MLPWWITPTLTKHLTFTGLLFRYLHTEWFYIVVYTRSRYNTDSSQVVFLAVSDDQAWIKVNKTKRTFAFVPMHIIRSQVISLEING